MRTHNGHPCQAQENANRCYGRSADEAPFCPAHWARVSPELRSEILSLQERRAARPNDEPLRLHHWRLLQRAMRQMQQEAA